MNPPCISSATLWRRARYANRGHFIHGIIVDYAIFSNNFTSDNLSQQHVRLQAHFAFAWGTNNGLTMSLHRSCRRRCEFDCFEGKLDRFTNVDRDLNEGEHNGHPESFSDSPVDPPSSRMVLILTQYVFEF